MRRPPSREPRAPAPRASTGTACWASRARGRDRSRGTRATTTCPRGRWAASTSPRRPRPCARHGHGADDVARHLAAHGRLGPPRDRQQAQVVLCRLEDLPRLHSGEVGVERGGRGHLVHVGHGHEEAAARPLLVERSNIN